MRSIGLSLLALSSVCLAQAVQDFPADATVPSAKEITEHIAGKNFKWRTAGGDLIRVQFTGRGYIYVDAPRGGQTSGDWRTEDGKLCGTLRGSGAFCNEARMSEGVLHLRRTNGEIVRYEPD